MRIERVDVLGDEPIELPDARRHCRVHGRDDDDYLFGLIKAARELCEHHTQRALVLSRFRQHLECWPAYGPIRLDRPPLVAVESVTYTDTADQQQTLPADQYAVSTGDGGRVALVSGASWPGLSSYAEEPASVTFTAGYGSVPETVKQACRMLVSHWYEHRTAVVMGRPPAEVPMAVDSCLNSVTWGRYA
ncbi:MAG: head-tail connector protein [Planctomycetota bacterium]